MIERRKHQRYTIDSGPVVVHSDNIGTIENISRGGMCCTCINDEFDPESHNSVDILCSGYFCMRNLGINILKKEMTTGESVFTLFTRKCHIEFANMTEIQLAQLNDFIMTHSHAAAMPR